MLRNTLIAGTIAFIIGTLVVATLAAALQVDISQAIAQGTPIVLAAALMIMVASVIAREEMA